MGHHHVLEGARRLVEGHPVVDRERLGDVDLHVVDVIPIPDRLEEAVGEAEGQDVLRRFLTQEVVDAEDLVLVEDLVHGVVQRDGAGQVGAERLLHDDPGTLDQFRVRQQLDHRARRRRRDAQVVQPARFPDVHLLFGAGHRLGHRLRPAARRAEAQTLLEIRPLEQRDPARRELVTGVARQLTEILVAELPGCAPDDPVLGHHPHLRQVKESRQQLARRQVSGRAEQHDHVRFGLPAAAPSAGMSPTPPSLTATWLMASVGARSTRPRSCP